MQLPLPVQVIKQSGQGGGLARTGRAGDQHQPRRQLGNLPEHAAQAQLGKAAHPTRNHPQYRRRPSALGKRIDPKPRQTRQGDGEIGFQKRFEILFLRLRHQLPQQLKHLFSAQDRLIQTAKPSIQAYGWRLCRRQVQVRGPGPCCQGQQFSHIHETPQRLPSR
ncbi:hypothetical protein D3C84_730080 [compost metagenome]